ncbi:MAG: hypothetical protein IV097_20295 [Burkholderiaceae bacterium]|nr:hypothetical protein [Burkholderiaceae bacterium]
MNQPLPRRPAAQQEAIAQAWDAFVRMRWVRCTELVAALEQDRPVDTVTGLRVQVLSTLLELRKSTRLSAERLQQVLDLELRVRDEAEPWALAEMHLLSCRALRLSGAPGMALHHAAQAIEAFEQLQAWNLLIHALPVQMNLLNACGHFETVIALAPRWLSHSPALEDKVLMRVLGTAAEAHKNLAEAGQGSEHWQAALDMYGQALALAYKDGESLDVAAVEHINLALALAALGQTAPAQEQLDRFLDLSRRPELAASLSSVNARVWLAYCQGLIAHNSGDLPAAGAHWAAALTIGNTERANNLAVLIKTHEALLRHARPETEAALIGTSLDELIRLHREQTQQQQSLAAAGMTEFIHAAQLAGENRVLRGHTDELMREVSVRNDELRETVTRLQREMGLRERAEQALQQSHDQLELRVMERTEQLALASEALVRQERLASMGRLMAGFAHRLNTPLGNARLAMSSIHAQGRQFADAQQQPLTRQRLNDFVTLVNQASTLGEDALALASDLMEAFKEASALDHAEACCSYAPAAVIEQVAASMQRRLREADVELHLELAAVPAGWGLPGVLARVLRPLMDNALVHGQTDQRPGGIWVQLAAVGDEYRISIIDQGPGIAAARLQHIFEPFNAELHQARVGLGLHLAHSLSSNLLAGRLSAHSNEGQGCSFVLQLPQRLNTGS